jgi:hypothetical protein
MVQLRVTMGCQGAEADVRGTYFRERRVTGGILLSGARPGRLSALSEYAVTQESSLLRILNVSTMVTSQISTVVLGMSRSFHLVHPIDIHISTAYIAYTSIAKIDPCLCRSDDRSSNDEAYP